MLSSTFLLEEEKQLDHEEVENKIKISGGNILYEWTKVTIGCFPLPSYWKKRNS